MPRISKQARERSRAVHQKYEVVQERTRKQKARQAAEKALQRAMKVESSYHTAKFIQHLTQARYSGQEPLASLEA